MGKRWGALAAAGAVALVVLGAGGSARAPARAAGAVGGATRAGIPSSLSYLAPGYVATALPITMPPGAGVGGLVVRPDGGIIVWPLAADGQPWDGYLHLLARTGGVVNQADRFGPPLPSPAATARFDYRSLALAAANLWVMGTVPSGPPHNGQTQLWELDPYSGALEETFWVAAPYTDDNDPSGQQITADPAGGGVLLTDYDPPGPRPYQPPTQPGAQSGAVTDPSYNLVDMSPDGTEHVVAKYQAGGGEWDRWFYPRSLVVSPDGTDVIAAEEGESGEPDVNSITAYFRTGSVHYFVGLPLPDQDPPTDTPVAMAWGTNSCLAGSLFFGIADGSDAPAASGDLFGVDQPGGQTDYQGSEVAQAASETGKPTGFGMLLAPDPNGTMLFTLWSSVLALGCTPPVPPPPARVVTVTKRAAVTGLVRPVVPSGPSPAASVRAAPPAGPPSLPTPPGAAGAPASLQASSQGAAQASASPNVVGVAEAGQEEPAMAMPATALAPQPVPPTWLGALGLTGAAGIAAAWVVIIPDRRRRAALALGERRS